MKQSFFPENGIWRKGNLHSHTTRTDGLCPPDQQIRDYCAQGYDFLAISDHNVVDCHQLGADADICMVPAWERDIRHNEANTKCIHVVGLIPGEAKDVPVREARRYEVLEVSDQQLIDEMAAEGQFLLLAHPQWSRMTPNEVLELKGYHAIEVFNTGCERLMHAGRADLYWDLLLQSGRKVWGVACDDTHGKTEKPDRFGGWVMVRTEDRTVKSLLAVLSEGLFYSTQGPVIEDWGMEDGSIYLECSPCKEIHVISYPTRGQACYAAQGNSLTGLRYTPKGGEAYIRIECIDAEGNSAWTNPHFF